MIIFNSYGIIHSMKRVVAFGLKHMPKKSKTTRSKKRRSIKHKKHIDLIRRSAFILASAVCGFSIVCIRIVTALNSGGLSTAPAPAVTEVAPQKEDTPVYPTQDNPLFAAQPTWIQAFLYQKNGILDPKYWNVLVGPAENSNQEQQYYTANRENFRIENGVLRLIATKGSQPEGYQYGSARIETQNKQTFLYGRIDIEAKLPVGVGTWPAVWLLPANTTYAEKSPESNLLRYKNGGEMDVIEAVGHEPDNVYAVAHTAADLIHRTDGTGSFNVIKVPNSATTFNKYTLLWTPTSLSFAVNEKVYFTYTRQTGATYMTWPFDQPFYLIANLAMGGTWGGLDTDHFPGNGIDDSALPASLDIRSIYYYPYIGPTDVK